MSLTGWENIWNGNLWNGIKSTFSQVGKGLYNFGSKLWNDFTGNTANNKNLEFQRENLDYQKAIQQEIFNREDTSYQRTVNDMRLAGLNPVSMQGTNGSGEAIATNAPETQRTSDIQALSEIMNVISQLNVNRNNNSVSQAQSNLLKAQADNQKIKNIYEEQLLGKTIEQLDLSNIGKRFKNQRDNISWQQELRNLAFNEQFGVSDNMSDFAKILSFATHQGNLPKNWYKNQMPDSWDNFGKYYNYTEDFKNPSFSNLQSLLEKFNLKGAINESALGNMFLKILGIN